MKALWSTGIHLFRAWLPHIISLLTFLMGVIKFVQSNRGQSECCKSSSSTCSGSKPPGDQSFNSTVSTHPWYSSDYTDEVTLWTLILLDEFWHHFQMLQNGISLLV